MSPDRLLEVAAASTLARIRRDEGRAAPLVKPLFHYLESHLFDPDLNADQLMRACGVGSPGRVSKGFRETATVSLAPYGYIEDCRLEVASRLLLLSPNLTLTRISKLIGYANSAVFGDAFERWSGLRPTAYRAGGRSEPGGGK